MTTFKPPLFKPPLSFVKTAVKRCVCDFQTWIKRGTKATKIRFFLNIYFFAEKYLVLNVLNRVLRKTSPANNEALTH